MELVTSLAVYSIWVTVLAAVSFYTLHLTTKYRTNDAIRFRDLVKIQSDQINRLLEDNKKLFEENIELRR